MIANFPKPAVKDNVPVDENWKQALPKLLYLWKTADPDWIAQREADWQLLLQTAFDDYPKAEKKELGEYFKYGRKLEYIPVGDSFFLTPYDSPESLLQLFNSGMLDRSDRDSMLSGYIFDADRFAACHWYERHTTLFVEAILGNTYCEVFEGKPPHRKMLSLPPSKWCDMYTKAIECINEDIKWRPIYLCVDYFISALPHATDMRDRQFIEVYELLELVNTRLAEGDMSGRLLTFASELKSKEQDILKAWEIGEQKLAAMGNQS
ncbi:hypothetical protein L2750_17925 [Shewanella submarina]|uniref:Uncharacterized protein n=1 Tax=Shewanella submarina TaxID=2016376 RepID=A0ABV7GCU3_9GAMM|nr:hypothetical protein [Shewanella submarina]MCL1039012.1 hypothetical protein [Shewanella submarina]